MSSNPIESNEEANAAIPAWRLVAAKARLAIAKQKKRDTTSSQPPPSYLSEVLEDRATDVKDSFKLLTLDDDDDDDDNVLAASSNSVKDAAGKSKSRRALGDVSNEVR